MKTHFVLPYKEEDICYKHALEAFLDPFREYLNKNLENYEIIIVEQMTGPTRNGKTLFNLGRNINIGFDIFSKDMKDDDIFIFHPVDIIPLDTDYKINKTTKFCSKTYHEFYYKAVGFPVSVYKQVNGFSNKIWGWGQEDDEMFKRWELQNIQFDTVTNNYKELLPNSLLHDQCLLIENTAFVRELVQAQTCMISGLNDLKYKILNTLDYNGVKRHQIS